MGARVTDAKWVARLAVAGLVAGLLLAPTSGRSQVPERVATLRDFQIASTYSARPTQDFGKKPTSKDDKSLVTQWQIIPNTGNCCENYISSNANGDLFDFGGDWVRFSPQGPDGGFHSWKEVLGTPSVTAGGEGAVAMAPGNDVVGLGWFPYTGDRLMAFKFENETKTWLFNEVPVHTPFFDREWLVSVPGPFSVAGDDVDYITIAKGGWPSKELSYMSLDGLTYVPMGSKQVQGVVQTSSGPLKVKKDPAADLLQPNTNTHITALGDGVALAGADVTTQGWWVLDPATFTWRQHYFPGDLPTGRILADSLGRLHNVGFEDDGKKLVWRISTDGGEEWSRREVALPGGLEMEEFDFKAHGALGIGAVGIHALDPKKNKDRDLVFRFDIRGARARLTRIYDVGLGDTEASSGVTSSIARYDFATVTILPNGRIATSILDSTTGEEPGLAIEHKSSRR